MDTHPPGTGYLGTDPLEVAGLQLGGYIVIHSYANLSGKHCRRYR